MFATIGHLWPDGQMAILAILAIFDIDQDQKAAASAQQNYCYVSSSV